VINNDPVAIGKLENFFDVIVIDAPCSGSGLFRREREAIAAWSEEHVQLCSQRQQRILADIYPALKPGGVLIFSTCSYSPQENETIADWLTDEFELDSLRLSASPGWGIMEVCSEKNQAYGYRFFPGKVSGEGFFIACFRKQDTYVAEIKQPKKPALQKASRNETEVVKPWLLHNSVMQLWKHEENIFAFPASLEKELLILAGKLYIRKAGILTGRIARNDLVPDHNLALSMLVNNEIVVISLKLNEALQYLRREDVMIITSHKGRTLVQYAGINLGWVNILPNRINNYYPVAWRILKSGSN